MEKDRYIRRMYRGSIFIVDLKSRDKFGYSKVVERGFKSIEEADKYCRQKNKKDVEK